MYFRQICALFVLGVIATIPLAAQTAGDRTSVDLTIYNFDLALIRETRPITLGKGLNTLVIPDIPATIDGTSVHFSSLTDPSAVSVLEQNFQYDLVHPAKLLEKYLGKEVEFVRQDPATNKEYSVMGKLLATGWQPQNGNYGLGNQPLSYGYSGQMIAEINGKIELNPAGRLLLPSLPEGLILKPQLQWLLTSSRGGTQNAEISYLAKQLSWDCNYVVVLNETDSRLNLTGWVTLRNNSGTSFKNAGLKLVAGDLNLVQDNLQKAAYAMGAMARNEAAVPQFQQKELFEYKLYSLQRTTDLADNETKQIELVSGTDVRAKKIFVYDGLADAWQSWWNNSGYRDQKTFGQQSNPKMGVFISFLNSKDGGLGVPLPKGKIRVYKKDADGKEQFIGEDQIDHTPKDEEVRLYLGNAFDIVGSRVQKDFRVIVPGHSVEEKFEITVKNHKDEDVEVLVYEHPWRWNEWVVTKSDQKWEKVDQSTVRFPVKVERNSEKKISYTVRYTW